MGKLKEKQREERKQSSPKKGRRKVKKKAKKNPHHLSTKPKVHIDEGFFADKKNGARKFYDHYRKGPWRLFRALGCLWTIECLTANIRRVWDKKGKFWDVRTNIRGLSAHLDLHDSRPINSVN